MELVGFLLQTWTLEASLRQRVTPPTPPVSDRSASFTRNPTLRSPEAANAKPLPAGLPPPFFRDMKFDTSGSREPAKRSVHEARLQIPLGVVDKLLKFLVGFGRRRIIGGGTLGGQVIRRGFR